MNAQTFPINQLTEGLHHSLNPEHVLVDLFAGGGGASEGIESFFGRPIDIAVNHSIEAIEMHKANHPETKHYCENVFDVDPRVVLKGDDGRQKVVGYLWASPDCTHHSKSRGGVPVRRDIRGLAWIVVRWCLYADVRSFSIENVPEFMSWCPTVMTEAGEMPDKTRAGETFQAFIDVLTTGLSPKHPAFKEMYEFLKLKDEYDIGLKMQLVKGLGYSLDYKKMKAHHFGAPTIRERLFIHASKDRPVAWPKPTHGPQLQPYRTAADCIDWSLPVKSIFGRKRPLAEKSMERLARGIDRFVINNDKPYLLEGSQRVSFITEYANASHQRNFSVTEPLRTICAGVKGGHFALVSAELEKLDSESLQAGYIMKMRGTNLGHQLDQPLHTISAGGTHHAFVAAFLIKYYGNSFGEDLRTPLGSVTTRDRFGLVVIKGEQYQIVDIGLRMLTPRELFNAQGFREDYIIDHSHDGKPTTKRAQVARCGNSVPPPFSYAIARANFTPSKSLYEFHNEEAA